MRSENVELQGLLKEQKSTESKERESTNTSGNSSDGQTELTQSVEKAQTESKGHSKLLGEKGEKILKNTKEVSDEEIHVTTRLIVSTAEGIESPQTEGQTHSGSVKHYIARHGVSFVLQQ